MKNINRIISGIVAAALLGLCLAGIPSLRLEAEAASGSFSAVGGWYEALYAEIEGISDASVTSVSYSGPVSGQLVGQDLEYLVRAKGSDVRIDIPGLKPGNYSLTVIAGGVAYTQSGIQVTAYDRSGYAHWNYTQGVGAYNDDGTIKDNAVILYVTEETKDSVSLTAGGLTVTGIGNILNTSGRVISNGKTGNGGLANTNGDILRKLAEENRPLVVRIIGSVTAPEGVTAWNSYDYGGGPDSNGAMARMQNCRDITIEGIGSDATVDGWGFSAECRAGNTAEGLGIGFEFRNLTFQKVPLDAIGVAGTMTGASLTDPTQRCWVHNCAFYGYTSLVDEATGATVKPDGACDYKRGQYFTLSYCYFDTYQLAALIGGADNDLQYHITWHHNYFRNCYSRCPLTRQANVHYYNNILEGQTSYCMSLRANCYVFSEYNLFLSSKRVTDNRGGGVCKSYNDTFSASTGTDNADLVIVGRRDQAVASENIYAGFENDGNLSYIPAGDYILHEEADEIQKAVKNRSGPMKDLEETPELTPVINESSIIHNFTENGLESSFYAISGNLSKTKGTVSFDDKELTTCLKLERATTVDFTSATSGYLTLVFHETGYQNVMANLSYVNIDGKPVGVGSDNTLTVALAAGEHAIRYGSAQIFLYYMVFTPAAAEDESHTHSYENGICTVCGEKELGVTLSGSYKAFGGAGNILTIQLIPAGFEDAAYTFTNAAAPEVSGSWSIDGVAAGSYTVLVTKQNHVAREYALTVGDEAAALDVEVWLIGDVTGDGLVNFSDYSKVLSQSKKPNSQILTDYAFLCGDVTGDSAINFADYSKVLSQAKGKGSLWQ